MFNNWIVNLTCYEGKPNPSTAAMRILRIPYCSKMVLPTCPLKTSYLFLNYSDSSNSLNVASKCLPKVWTGTATQQPKYPMKISLELSRGPIVIRKKAQNMYWHHHAADACVTSFSLDIFG